MKLGSPFRSSKVRSDEQQTIAGRLHSMMRSLSTGFLWKQDSADVHVLQLGPERSMTSVLNEVQREEENLEKLKENPWFRIDPEGAFKTWWDVLMLFMVYYVSLATPLDLAFFRDSSSDLLARPESQRCQTNDELHGVLSTLSETDYTQDGEDLSYYIFLERPSLLYTSVDTAVDVLFWIDLAMTFFVGFKPSRSLTMEYDFKKIARRYLAHWFFIDFVAVVPIDRIVSTIVSGSSVQVRIVKLTRLLRLSRLLKRIGELMASKSFRILYLLILYTTIAHWIGCAFFFSGRWQVENLKSGGANSFTGNPWLMDQCLQFANFRTQYCMSLYWAFTTMTTVGYGDVLPTTNIDRNVASIVMVLGGIIQAIIFGNVAILIQAMGEARKRLQNKLDGVQEYLNFHDVPEHLVQKAMDAIEYSWSNSQGVVDRAVLSNFPKALRTDLMIQSRSEVPRIFLPMGEGFQREVISHFHLRIFVPEDYIIHAGDTGSEMFVIREGECAVLSPDETHTLAVLTSGDFFGDIDMILRTRRMATVKAVSYCTVFVLRREDLEAVLEKIPDARELLVEITRRRMEELKQKNASFTTKVRTSSCGDESWFAIRSGQIPSPTSQIIESNATPLAVELEALVEQSSLLRDCLQRRGSSTEGSNRSENQYGFNYPVFSPAPEDI